MNRAARRAWLFERGTPKTEAGRKRRRRLRVLRAAERRFYPPAMAIPQTRSAA